MSKKVDETKIERIRNAAVSLIGREGVANCSVASIAREAGVSVGYLYRHYPGKGALINDLWAIHFNVINEIISALISDRRGAAYVVEGVVRHIMEVAGEDGEKARFLIMLLHDFSIGVDPALSARVDALAAELMHMVSASPECRRGLTKEDLFFALIGVPVQYLTLRYSHIFSLEEGDCGNTDHVVRVALNVLMNSK